MHWYFHNVPYEQLWKDNRRRASSAIPTVEVLRTYRHDYRVIMVGDASMSPYEIVQPGGSVEHWNSASGAVRMQRLCATFPRLVWLNPVGGALGIHRFNSYSGRGAHVSPDPSGSGLGYREVALHVAVAAADGFAERM